MLQSRYKLRSQADCERELVSHLDIQHRNEDPVVETKELGLPINTIRRSTPLQKKEIVTSCAQDNFMPEIEESGLSTNNIRRSARLQKKEIVTSCSPDNFIPEEGTAGESLKSSSYLPSFEFHARSDEGIKLVVDLNSSPSDWLRSMENEICLCQKCPKRKFQSFRQELEYLGNSNNLVRSSLIKTASDGEAEGHSVCKENGHMRSDQPADNDESSKSSLSASGVSSTKCCSKVGEMESSDCVVRDAIQANNSIVNLRKKGSEDTRTVEEHSTVPFSQVLEENQSIKEMRNNMPGQSENRSGLVASSTHKKWKRHHLKSNCISGPHGRILRNTKHFNGLVLRRSKRLVSQ